MVWRAVRSVLVEKWWNYIGLGALAGIDVHLSKELQWFGAPQEKCSSKKRGITMVRGALTGIDVHLSKELQCFGEP